jgi:hypothetical protein
VEVLQPLRQSPRKNNKRGRSKSAGSEQRPAAKHARKNLSADLDSAAISEIIGQVGSRATESTPVHVDQSVTSNARIEISDVALWSTRSRRAGDVANQRQVQEEAARLGMQIISF